MFVVYLRYELQHSGSCFAHPAVDRLVVSTVGKEMMHAPPECLLVRLGRFLGAHP